MKPVFIALVLFFGLNLASTWLHADIDVYEFSTEEKRDRYLGLIKELRCPKCQNQDIADSNAPIAQDMRREVHRMVEEGKAHQDVVSFMVERFGEFVSYKPKIVPSTYLLWFGPVILILLGLGTVWSMASRKRKRDEAEKAHVDANQKAKIEDLLARYDDAEDKHND